ncbi:MAG: hypothetical protein AAF571_04035 [Verrucomicrobiota bacterium]
MKAILILATTLLLSCLTQAGQLGTDWVSLELQNGTRVDGYVVQVSEENVHLVSASINRRIGLDQLSEKSLLQLNATFPVTATTEPAPTTATAATLKADLQHQREQLYQRVSDIYSPHSYRHHSIQYGPYQRSYYLPQGCSIAYPVYRHHYRTYYSIPRWSIQIDL